MQALRWHGREDLRLESVAEPGDPPDGSALVEVSYCGVCGTDLHEYAAGPSMIRPGPHPLTGYQPPVTLGHEISGRVVALGGPVPGVDIGSRVAVDPCLRCGTCYWCRRGEYHICAKGGSVGLASPGAFAPLVLIPADGLVPIPDRVPDEHAAAAEPLAVGLHAVHRAGLRPGDNVLIIGAGPIGIAVLLAARLAGAAEIFVSEPVAARGERALALEAADVFDPGAADVRREVFLRTGRIGPDVVVEATGRPDCADLAISAVRRGGRVVLAGVSTGRLASELTQIVLYERVVLGSLGYNFDIPRVLALMASGQLDASPFVTGTFPLESGREVFAELAAHPSRHLKVLLTPKGQ
jgi:(R,R)-butanediol dehydrogenase / meso-butanediol dehydrogenase / diacetyl reductase